MATDLVSIIHFNSQATLKLHRQDINNVLGQDISEEPYGGTKFLPAIHKIRDLIV